MNTENLMYAINLIQEFQDINTIHSEQVYKLNKIKKDLLDFVDSINIIYGAVK